MIEGADGSGGIRDSDIKLVPFPPSLGPLFLPSGKIDVVVGDETSS